MLVFLVYKDHNVVFVERVPSEALNIAEKINAKNPLTGQIVKMYFKKYLRNKRGALFLESTKEGEILGG